MPIMITSFADPGTEAIYHGDDTKRARKTLPAALWKVARRKLDMLYAVKDVSELRKPPGNRLEALSGDRRGQYAIRINDQYRVCFGFEDGNAFDVEIVDYHKG